MSVKQKIENLIKVYNHNISDNKSRIKKYFSNDKEMSLKLEQENECLTAVILELKDAIKLKSEK